MEQQIKTNPAMPLLEPDKPNIVVGRYTYGKPTILTWTDKCKVNIGSFCSIAGGVVIFGDSEHRPDWITTYPIRILFNLPGAWQDGCPVARGDTVIGNDVWIGHRATILSGVTIGDGAVIGAGAVVSKDVEPYAVAAGNPAKAIRRRFDKQTIEALLKIKWWDWPVEKIVRNADILCSGDVERLKLLFATGRL